jgi:hypothetical protein
MSPDLPNDEKASRVWVHKLFWSVFFVQNRRQTTQSRSELSCCPRSCPQLARVTRSRPFILDLRSFPSRLAPKRERERDQIEISSQGSKQAQTSRCQHPRSPHRPISLTPFVALISGTWKFIWIDLVTSDNSKPHSTRAFRFTYPSRSRAQNFFLKTSRLASDSTTTSSGT